MYTVNEKTTVVGVSELRSKWEKIKAAMKNSRVLVAHRNTPDAVLVPIHQFEEMEALLDRVEDYALAYQAHQREKHAKPSDYVSFEDALRKLK